MHEPELHPHARTEGLLTQQLDDELVVYDTVSHEAHSLDARAAALWRACDGRTSVDALARDAGLDQEGVLEALSTFEDRSLLVAPLPRSSRRAVLRGGIVAGGALVVGAPVIRSIVAPTAASAQSGPCQPNGDPCTMSSHCCSGQCATYDGAGGLEGICF